MSITLDESFIPVGDAPAHIPGTPHVSSVWRWIRKGIRGRKLEAVKCGGRTFTTTQAIERFLAATNGSVVEGSSTDRVEAAERALRAAGF